MQKRRTCGNNFGQYDKALEEARETLRLNANGDGYANLAGSYLSLNRLEGRFQTS